MAKFIYSLDFELGWGVVEAGLWERREKLGVYSGLRPVFTEFIQFLNDLEFPVTFATVGAMIDESVEVDFSYLPDDLRESAEDFIHRADKETYDGRDLFDQIIKSNINHKIASHTYSHTRFSHPSVDSTVILQDLQKFNEVLLKEYSLSVDQLVFPQNHERFYEILPLVNIFTARGVPSTHANTKIQKLLEKTIGVPPMVEEKQIGDSVKRHAGSLFYHSGTGRNRIKLPFNEYRAAQAIDKAIKTDGTFHIWNHPFNLSESKALNKSVKKLLLKVARLRDAGKIHIGHM